MTPLEIKAIEAAVHQLRMSALIHRAAGDVTMAEINAGAADNLATIIAKREAEVAS